MDTVTRQVLTSAVRRLDVILEKIHPESEEGVVRPQLVELEGILRGLLEQKQPDAHYTSATLTDEVARLRKVGNDMLRALKNLLAADAAVMIVGNAPIQLVDKRGITVLSVEAAIKKAEEVLR